MAGLSVLMGGGPIMGGGLSIFWPNWGFALLGLGLLLFAKFASVF